MLPYSRDELREAAVQFAFDAQHFRFYVRLYRSGELARRPVFYQAAVYALLIHLRLIVDFFFEKPKHDDVSVLHFREMEDFDHGSDLAKVAPPDGIKELREHLNKRLAHLTATRWREQAPRMEYYAEFFESVESHLDAFENALPADFKARYQQALRLWDRSKTSLD